MGNLGWSEMFFIVVFALIIFGPRRLPEIAKTLGRTVAQLRRASEEFKHTWESEAERITEADNAKKLIGEEPAIPKVGIDENPYVGGANPAAEMIVSPINEAVAKSPSNNNAADKGIPSESQANQPVTIS